MQEITTPAKLIVSIDKEKTNLDGLENNIIVLESFIFAKDFNMQLFLWVGQRKHSEKILYI